MRGASWNVVGPGLAARAGIALVRFYQRFLSGLKPPTCRYYPSCSEYAAQAVAHRGLVRGLLLAAWRLLRCNPFSPGGYDPGPWATEREAALAAVDRRAKEEDGREGGCE
jgi:putative membrane protein insertion efficiency factor